MPTRKTERQSRSKAPSRLLLALEPVRACMELALHILCRPAIPSGSGPVIVYPGLATNHLATTLLRFQLRAAGYTVYDWGRGINLGPQGEVTEWFAGLAADVERLAQEHGQPVSLIGWSLGGILAREVSRLVPASVRQVVTLGSPFSATPDETNAGLAYKLLNLGKEPTMPEGFMEGLAKPIPVPSTSIFSRTDGVVPWARCKEKQGPKTRNIELPYVSHFGLVCNPCAIGAIGQALASALPRGVKRKALAAA